MGIMRLKGMIRMKIKYVNVDDKEFSSFAYVICEENGKLFSPVYNKRNRIAYFTEVEIVNTYLLDTYENDDIHVGSRRIFAYYCNYKVYLGEKGKIRAILLGLLDNNSIHTPFAMLEVIQFLNIKGKKKLEVLKKCHDFLAEHVNAGSLRMWEESVKYKEPAFIKKQTNISTDPRDDYIKSLPELMRIGANKARSFSLTPDLREGMQYGN